MSNVFFFLGWGRGGKRIYHTQTFMYTTAHNPIKFILLSRKINIFRSR